MKRFLIILLVIIATSVGRSLGSYYFETLEQRRLWNEFEETMEEYYAEDGQYDSSDYEKAIHANEILINI